LALAGFLGGTYVCAELDHVVCGEPWRCAKGIDRWSVLVVSVWTPTTQGIGAIKIRRRLAGGWVGGPILSLPRPPPRAHSGTPTHDRHCPPHAATYLRKRRRDGRGGRVSPGGLAGSGPGRLQGPSGRVTQGSGHSSRTIAEVNMVRLVHPKTFYFLPPPPPPRDPNKPGAGEETARWCSWERAVRGKQEEGKGEGEKGGGCNETWCSRREERQNSKQKTRPPVSFFLSVMVVFLPLFLLMRRVVFVLFRFRNPTESVLSALRRYARAKPFNGPETTHKPTDEDNENQIRNTHHPTPPHTTPHRATREQQGGEDDRRAGPDVQPVLHNGGGAGGGGDAHRGRRRGGARLRWGGAGAPRKVRFKIEKRLEKIDLAFSSTSHSPANGRGSACLSTDTWAQTLVPQGNVGLVFISVQQYMGVLFHFGFSWESLVCFVVVLLNALLPPARQWRVRVWRRVCMFCGSRGCAC